MTDNLQNVRISALKRFQSLGLPTRKSEDFKYTSLKFLEATSFESELKSNVELNLIDSLKLNKAYHLVVVDGTIHEKLSSSEVLSLTRALSTKVDLDNTDAIGALTLAHSKEVLEINIAPRVSFSQPIQIIHLGTAKKNSTFFVRINVGESSSVEVLETLVSGTESTQLIQTDFHCSSNSKVIHYRIQSRDELSKFLGHTRSELMSHCDYSSFTLNLGAELGRDHNEVIFVGEESRGRIFCGFLAGQDQHLDQQSLVEHKKGHNTSLQQYRGIIGGNGKGIFNGIVRIDKDAQKANSEQSSKNLLLSEKAEVNSKPHLEIFADDVKAAHGTTVGQLSPEEVFYLQSRGIPKRQSEQLLTEGFVLDIINEIQNYNIKTLFSEAVRRKLSPV